MASITGPADPADDLDDLLRDYKADTLALGDRERRILELYDQVQQNDLEQQILHAEVSGHDVPDDLSGLSDDTLRQHMISAERKMLDARAAYLTRTQTVLNTLVMDPVLKAVHSGGNSTSLERQLLPMLNRRDVLSLSQATLDSKRAAATAALAESQRGNITTNQENQRLAQILLELAEEMKAQADQEVQDPKLRDRLQKLETEVQKSRRDWRTVKSILSAVIVGSGVEWSKDVGLRELVMDDEDDVD